jgi:hypothetical protein
MHDHGVDLLDLDVVARVVSVVTPKYFCLHYKANCPLQVLSTVCLGETIMSSGSSAHNDEKKNLRFKTNNKSTGEARPSPPII